ncbi:helix-turn-helix domain-containing protein [Oceanibacterium hippocampi]|uniref:HTH-type transcriptional regulator YesS n=1 Tax=Oceanibacterium hippocampi TaxID=745714 RepID=A0A1Y5TY88_9PROT|nr:AraC family transcriptional regulator [Oceanibacterium hippocampi]SLN71023.1 HTH-type transcriptional regulator YesS [Oceanibacterium hippocampi]
MTYEYVLDKMDVDTEPFALCELRGNCDLGLGRRPSATLHYILAGQGEIRLPGQQQVPVGRGSLVLVPAMHSHTLRSFGEGGDVFPVCNPAGLNLALHARDSREQNRNSQLVALCTHVSVGLGGTGNLIDLVREPITERTAADSALQASLQAIIGELSQPGLGSRAMIRALLLQCMIEILRKRLSAGDPALAWMAALADQDIWKALGRMLDAPGDAHTVESLAREVGMSRSTFALRFANACGSGPMELLRSLRVMKAGSLLEETNLPVKRVAERVGFRSRSAFTRMFEGHVGLSPQQFRKSRRNAP